MLNWVKSVGSRMLKHKKAWVGCLIGVGLVIAVCIPYVKSVRKEAASGSSAIARNVIKDDNTGIILRGDEVCQTIYSSRNQVLGVSIAFGTHQNTSDCDVEVEVIDTNTGETVEQWAVNARDLKDLEYKEFRFTEPISDGKNKTYKTIVTSPNGTLDNGVVVLTSSSDAYREGKLWINGIEKGGDVTFRLLTQSGFLNKGYICIAIVILLGFGMLYCGMFYLKLKIEYIFLLMAFLIGGMYIVLFSPYSTPDEGVHIATVYYNANLLMGKPALDQDGNVLVRKDDLEMSPEDLQPSKDVYNTIRDRIVGDKVDTERVSYFMGPLSVPITAHFPQTIGVIIGWALGLSGILTLYLAKMMSLIFYVGCCYIAIKKIPFGKMILFIIALLPMSMELATSCSYDSTVIALCLLFIGYCLYLAYDKEKVVWWDIGIMVGISVCMVPSKVVYILVCGTCFLIPIRKFKTKSVYYTSMLLVLLSGAIVILITRLATLSSILGGSSKSMEGEVTYTISAILSDIPHAIFVFFNTFVERGAFYIQTMLGGSLGWFELPVSWGILNGFIVLLALAVIKKPGERNMLTGCARSWMIFLSICMFGLISLALWLDWTPIHYNYIKGVQGRYFLPFLPMVLLACTGETLSLKKNIDYQLAITVFCLQSMAVLQIFTTIISR